MSDFWFMMKIMVKYSPSGETAGLELDLQILQVLCSQIQAFYKSLWGLEGMDFLYFSELHVSLFRELFWMGRAIQPHGVAGSKFGDILIRLFNTNWILY